MIVGILLAAGRGRRMGRTKQLLAWPAEDGYSSQPLIAAAFDAISHVCDAMVVVLGHEAEAVGKALGDREFVRVSSDPDAEMFSSVRAGLEAARRIDSGADALLQPGDHPNVQRATLNVIMDTARKYRNQAVMPAYQGQGGHPVLIPTDRINQIIDYRGPGGLRQFWIDHPQMYLRISVDDPTVILDLDIPADYEDWKMENNG